MASSGVPKLYRSVIEDVMIAVRDVFLDEGVDEQVLLELKQLWERKLIETKAIEHNTKDADTTSNATSSGTNAGSSAAGQNSNQRSSHGASHRNSNQHLDQHQFQPITQQALQQLPLFLVQQPQQQQGLQQLPPQILLQQQQGQGSINLGAQARVLQQNPTRPSQPNWNPGAVVQLDGPNDSSDDDEDEEEFRDNDDDNEDDQNDEEIEDTGEEEEPLNSEDDVSDEDPTELFETDNVVVCQYDKITRSRNKWKFHLKDGIMNLQGKDYVFQKAIGDAEW